MENDVLHKSEEEKNWYDRHYKKLLFIPGIILIFSVFYLYNFYQENGDFIYKGVSLTGGTSITLLDSNLNIKEIEEGLKEKFPDVETKILSDIRTGKQRGLVIETTSNVSILKEALEEKLGYKLTGENSSIEFSGSTLSGGFYKQLRFAVFISFILMASVVFIIFRTPIRSLSVMLAAFLDIMMTIVVLDILGIHLSIGGIVALLMLIGYSVDVDILLTARVVKNHEGTINQKIWESFKTGITMTLTSIVASAVALIFTFSVSPVLAQMFTVILIGLAFDIMNCWITNASILKWYMEGKKQ